MSFESCGTCGADVTNDRSACTCALARVRCKNNEEVGPDAVALVDITYFKESGKYYTEDTDVEWPRDPTHFTRYRPFDELVRIKGMYRMAHIEQVIGLERVFSITGPGGA